ncbi:MAG TPA: hypothetical protein VLW83_11040, partial [Candidatus Acidoferrales bacterium]|nr:hypothetical protein [Candidatus Acidoferrales bacterium]
MATGIFGMVLLSAVSSGGGGAEPLPLFSTPAPPRPSNSVLSVNTSANLRFFYQYSVIPGGIQSGDELREAVADDPVVADHYS